MRELIAYTDGGSRGNPGPAAAAAYYPNGSAPEGSKTAVVHDHVFLGIKTNNEAEYHGLLLALKRAIDDGYDRLHVYTDSEVMFKQVKGVYRCSAPTLIPLWEQVYTLRTRFSGAFEIEHVRREKNTEADRICNEVLDAHEV